MANSNIKRVTPLAFQFTKFGMIGLSNTVIDFTLLNLLHLVLKVPVLPANTVSFSCAVINSFVWNKYWTFQDKQTRNIAGQFIQFVIVSAIGLGFNNGIMYLAGSYLGGFSPLQLNLAKLAASTVSMLWNFIAYKTVVFRPTRAD